MKALLLSVALLSALSSQGRDVTLLPGGRVLNGSVTNLIVGKEYTYVQGNSRCLSTGYRGGLDVGLDGSEIYQGNFIATQSTYILRFSKEAFNDQTNLISTASIK